MVISKSRDRAEDPRPHEGLAEVAASGEPRGKRLCLSRRTPSFGLICPRRREVNVWPLWITSAAAGCRRDSGGITGRTPERNATRWDGRRRRTARDTPSLDLLRCRVVICVARYPAAAKSTSRTSPGRRTAQPAVPADACARGQSLVRMTSRGSVHGTRRNAPLMMRAPRRARSRCLSKCSALARATPAKVRRVT
jgi:hypothetical protein